MEAQVYREIQQVEQDHWWYVARRRIIFDLLLRRTRTLNNPRILDIGCGTGFNVAYLRSLGFTRVVGLDVAPEALDYCRLRHLTALVRGDATHAPFLDGAFDIILALDLIEHVEDDVTTIRGLARLLSPGGVLLIFTPAFQFLWGHQDEISRHFRRYTSGELRSKIEEAGLHVEKLTYANTFLMPLVWAGRLLHRSRPGAASARVTENTMHPKWSNGLLQFIFAAERPLLHVLNLPFGVSLLTLVSKPL
jgi:SAM-dependent methyltransferase